MFEFYNGGQEFLPGSSIVADKVEFTVGGGSTIRGTYDVTTSTTNSSYVLNFAEEANIISYGPSFYIQRWTVNFNAIVGGTIRFDTLSVGPGYSTGATANFNSGDPVHITNLILGPGTIAGTSDITIEGPLTWNGSSGFSGPGTVNADGDVLVNAASGQKNLSNCVFNNAATATFLGQFTMSGSAVFNNLATGVMDIQVDGGPIAGLGGNLNNAGMLVKSAGVGTSTISVHFHNSGTVEVQTGELSFYGGYGLTQTQTAGQTVLNGGDLAFTHSSAFYNIQGGLLTGAGTITGYVVNAGGTTAPGLSAGVLDIVGAYTQEAGGTLEIDIAGLNQGSEYDLLTVSGTASLAGNLEVIISTNRFAPVPGDSFQIITAGTVTGEFDPVTVPNLPPYLNMEVVYTTGAVTLDMVGKVPADCDLDGDADLDDHADLEACLSGPGGGIRAGCRCFDFDDNGDVDLGDFAEFQAAFTGL